jgi:prepilin-type N-terminal cleavage/methylation domain-containing protein
MMTTTFRRQIAKGFTLIELLIVVIIIAILAAIAIPQFSASTDDAKVAALDANLSTMRSAIEMYRVQHKNVLPAKNASKATGCPTGGTAGNADADSNQAFIDQLTMYSNAEGATCSLSDPKLFPYGPYVRAIPAEPGTNSTLVTVKATAAAADDGGGWLFSTLTGKFQANNTKDLVGADAAKPYSSR